MKELVGVIMFLAVLGGLYVAYMTVYKGKTFFGKKTYNNTGTSGGGSAPEEPDRDRGRGTVGRPPTEQEK